MININGYFDITPKLTDYDRHYLFNFHATPHMKRDPKKLDDLYDGSNGYVGDYGKNGELFIKLISDDKGKIINQQSTTYDMRDFDTVIDFNQPPDSQPNLQCPWKPNKDGTKLLTENTEHYQNNYKWIKWLINNFFKDKYILNGEYTTKTDDFDRLITLKNNKISYKIIKGKLKPPTRTIKTEQEILTNIINKTKNGNILWYEISVHYGKRYTSHIKIKGSIKVTIHLYIRDYSSTNNNYISIYLERSNSMKHYKMIKSYQIKELIKLIEK